MSDKKYLNKSMLEFVREKGTDLVWEVGFTMDNFTVSVIHYCEALSKIPCLGHFIPCDENDVPLEKPKQYLGALEFAVGKDYEEALKYKQACDRVLFEGSYISKSTAGIKSIANNYVHVFWYNLEKKDKWSLSNGVKTYEDLIRYNIQLTKAGVDFFGL